AEQRVERAVDQSHQQLGVKGLHRWSLVLVPKSASDTEIGVKLVHVGLQLGVGKAVDDLAVLDDVETVGHRRGEAEILLDQKDGEALLLEPRDGLADLLDDDGRKALGRLIQHQEIGAGAQ